MGWSYFVTGTDTGVGKTQVAAALLHRWGKQGLRVGAMKPIASGCRETALGLRNEDAESLIAESTVTLDYKDVNPYAFVPPIAPHLAAAEIGCEIAIQPLVDRFHRLSAGCDRFIVEGIGGWQVPLGDTTTTADLAKALGCPVLVVVGMRLGCLNHALLTVESLQGAGLGLAGWVANVIDRDCARQAELVATLTRRWECPPLGVVPWLEAPSPPRVASFLG